jgi:hypothetical protein
VPEQHQEFSDDEEERKKKKEKKNLKSRMAEGQRFLKYTLRAMLIHISPFLAGLPYFSWYNF